MQSVIPHMLVKLNVKLFYLELWDFIDTLLSVSSGLPKDELQTAIELSLQESHNAQEEEREFHRYKETCFLYMLLSHW